MKKFRLVIIFIIAICLVLSYGCSGGETDVKSNEDFQFNDEPIFTSIIHGSPNGLWFMLGSGISECLGRSYEGSMMELAPGQNLGNFLRLDEHSAEFGLTLTNTVYTGYNGLGSFEETHTDVGAIAIFYPSMLQFLLKKDSKVTTFDEFIQNKVPLTLSVGTKGAAAHVSFEAALQEYNLTTEDLENWGCKLYFKGLKDTSELFADGVLDGLWLVAGAPTPAVVQMGLNQDLVLVPLPNNIKESLVQKHGFNDYTFTGNSYSFEEDDFLTVCVFTMLSASSEVSDEAVYKVTKSICENTDYLSEIHSALKGLKPEKFLNGIPIPLHPGAEKYYREAGLID